MRNESEIRQQRQKMMMKSGEAVGKGEIGECVNTTKQAGKCSSMMWKEQGTQGKESVLIPHLTRGIILWDLAAAQEPAMNKQKERWQWQMMIPKMWYWKKWTMRHKSCQFPQVKGRQAAQPSSFSRMKPGLHVISVLACQPMNEWMYKREQMNEWTNEWKNEWMNEWMNEWINEWTKEQMNEWMTAWCMHECTS